MTEYKSFPVSFKASSEGAISAKFVTFGVIDHDGDIILPGAFTNGQEVAMLWSHDWQKIVGKGAIEVKAEGAYFHGSFFMDTEAGREAYKTVKAMGNLQEYSWGFQVLKHAYKTIDGQSIREIQKVNLFEVSPVLKGAGIGTRTVALKQQALEDLEKLQQLTSRLDDKIELAIIRLRLFQDEDEE